MAELSRPMLWVGGSIAFALIGLYLTRKLVKPIDVKGNADFLIATVTIVGTLVSVVLGLLVSSSVEHYRDMERNVDAEATSVTDIFRLARGLPGDVQANLSALCIEYCDGVVNDDWPSMKHGKFSEKVTRTYAEISDAIVGIKPATEQESNLQQSLVGSLASLGHSRCARVVDIGSNGVSRLLPILLLCAMIVLATSYVYADEKETKLNAVLVSFVAVALGSNIGIMVIMGSPLVGGFDIGPDQFALNARVMRQYKDKPLFSRP